MKEWKLQKPKVCLLNLSNKGTSNLKNFEPRFLSQVYGLERSAIFSIFWAIFFNFTQIYRKIQVFSNSFCCHCVKIIPKWKCYFKNLLNEMKFNFILFLQMSLLCCLWWINRSCHYWFCFVDSNFTRAIFHATIKFPIVVFHVWIIVHRPSIQL